MATNSNSALITLLAFDTSLDTCSVAVRINGEPAASCHEQMRRGQAERLLPMIEEVCASASLDYRDIDYLVTTIGPGSFTGVRVGLAAAKGLALVNQTPLIALTTTEAIAASLQNPPDGLLTVAIDAHREQVYWQQFRVVDSLIEPMTEAQITCAAELTELQPSEATTVAGSGRRIIADHWADTQVLDSEAEVAKAADFIAYGENLTARGQSASSVLPLYLRAPDAKLPKPR